MSDVNYVTWDFTNEILRPLSMAQWATSVAWSSQAPGSFWYGWGCSHHRKIVGVGGVEVCGVGVIGYEEVEQDR